MFDVEYISPPRYLSSDNHAYNLIRLQCSVGDRWVFQSYIEYILWILRSTHEFRICLCQGDNLLTDTHLIDVCGNEYIHLIVPHEKAAHQNSLRIDVTDK